MMDVGGQTETVEVNADQQPELKTDRADVATVFDQQQISALPVGDQNFTNLQLLLPGAQKLGWSHAADENPQGSQQIQVDGQAFGGTAFELDGTDNQDPILGIIVINPAMDAVTETKITTQNFDAELGKAVSAVVTAQTRSGSNSYHGSAYDFRTGNANQARDPYTQQGPAFDSSRPEEPLWRIDRRTRDQGPVLHVRQLRRTASEGGHIGQRHGADGQPDQYLPERERLRLQRVCGGLCQPARRQAAADQQHQRPVGGDQRGVRATTSFPTRCCRLRP